MKKSLLITAALVMGTAGYAVADNIQSTTFAKMDANGDSVLSKDEVQGRLLANFDKFDKDSNGTLSADEWPMRMQGKKGQRLTFAQIDANGDGVLSKDEVQGRLSANFDKFDKDSNGTLSADEWPMRMQGKNNKKGRKGPRISFAQMDANGDGVLSKDEVQGRLSANFDKFDKDSNGTLSADEWPMRMQGKHDDRGRKHPRPTFAQLDSNGDGSLSPSEYQAKPNALSGNQYKRMAFNALDNNNDQVLDKSEVRGPLLTDFDQFDTDSNGTLSLDELPRTQP